MKLLLLEILDTKRVRSWTHLQGADLYMFDDFQTSEQTEPRRPSCE